MIPRHIFKTHTWKVGIMFVLIVVRTGVIP